MPSQQAVSALMSKLGGRINKGLAANAAKPIVWGPDRLPPGIINGVAQIDKIELRQGDAASKNPGQWMCSMTAVIMEPEYVDHDGQRVRVRGRQTRWMETLADTKDTNGKPTSVEEHADRLANMLRAIMYAQTGGTFEVGQFEEAIQTVEEAAPFFHFGTRLSKETLDPVTGKVKYEARVWEDWHGSRNLPADYQPPEPEDGGVQDGGKPAPSANGAAAKPPTGGPVRRTPAAPAKVAKPVPQPEPAEEGGYQQMEELEGLVETASDKAPSDERLAARTELERLALEAGWRQQEIDDSLSWQAVADMASNPKEPAADGEGEGQELPADEEPVVDETPAWEPSKANPCSYQRLDAKGSPLKGKDRRILKPAACVVVSINAKLETAVLRLLEDNKTLFKDVPLADVLPPE